MDTRSAHIAQIFLDLHSPSRMKQKDIGAKKENYVIRFERLNDQTIARQRIVKKSNRGINELSINSDIIRDHFISSYLLYFIYIYRTFDYQSNYGRYVFLFRILCTIFYD